MEEKIYFYYTNDLHSNFTQWPKVAKYMKYVKEKRATANESCWIVDIGDHVDRVHPIAEAFMGKGNVELLNDVGYDYVTIGNNEGITLAHEDLFHLYENAQFQVVCANLSSTDLITPEWLNPTVEIQTVQGANIGIIGLTAPFNDYYELLGWHIDDPYEVLEATIASLKKNTDIIVLLSHLGISEDQEIARRFKEIDVILGGHTHHLLRTGEEVNQAILTAAGKHCYYIGEVILTWDSTLKKLVSKEAYATDITEYPNDLETEKKLRDLQLEAEQILNNIVVSTSDPIEVNWHSPTKIMQQLTDTILRETSADCAMFNSGLLLDGFTAGDITTGDIHRVCPHPINPCIVELTGSELLEVIRETYRTDFINLELKGFGFRGKILGKMVFSGIIVATGNHANGQEFVEDVFIKNQPIEAEKVYRIVTADTFTFGRLLPEIAKSEKKTYILPSFIRDFLAETLREHYGSASHHM
jgi:5'-nucleotidase